MAIKHYQNSKELSMRQSAEKFSISYSTLRDRLHGAQNCRESHQEQKLLTEHEEKTIVRWCERMDDWGFPLQLGLVKEMAPYLVKKWYSGHKLGTHWLGRFLDRNPEVASRFTTCLERQRAYADNPELLKDYFDKLKEVIQLYNLLPKNTYNMDEKGFMMGIASKFKDICRRGRKNPRLMHSGNREWVTVIEVVSAACVALPPMVINQGAGHYKGWYLGIKCRDVATFSYSLKGWTDSFLGMEWLSKNFEKYTSKWAAGEWRLLFMDGQASHLDKGLKQSITEKEIGDHIYKKFRQTVTKKLNANFGDCKRFTKARVITTEEVIRLIKAKERADAEKAAKAEATKKKKKLKEMQDKQKPPASKGRGRGKKIVTISEETIVHNLEPEYGVGVDQEDEGDGHMAGSERVPEGSTPPPSRKMVNKSWEKAQKD